MSNVIQLHAPSRQTPLDARIAPLISCFAFHRRKGDDVFWLKENAELLNILESSGQHPGAQAFAPLAGFYDTLEDRLEFFPQYYRFFLSMCLDLEDMGYGADKAAPLAGWVFDRQLPSGEMSDLQRLEAKRLLARRGIDAFPDDPGLEDRVRSFCRATDFFAIPNKKAAYELTHAVFYLSEYGRKDPGLDQAMVDSLLNVGILAMLEQNDDLVAEVCIALRYGGHTPPAYWENWLRRDRRAFLVEADAQWMGDDYHNYFMAFWLEATKGEAIFTDRYTDGPMGFFRAEPACIPLRDLSQILLEMEVERDGSWNNVQPLVEKTLAKNSLAVLNTVQASTSRFEAFFESFARVHRVRKSA
jgi:hypothetical protein